MKPVDQDRVGWPNGNCTAACIASLIEKPVEAVPNFNHWVPVFGHWEIAAAAWLRNCGWLMSPSWGYEWVTKGDGDDVVRPGEIVLAGGVNPAGINHMVLWRDGELAHDPNPSRAGLKGEPTFVITIRPCCARCQQDHAVEDCPVPEVLDCRASK